MATVTVFRPFSFLAPQEWTVFQAELTPTGIRISQDVRVQTFTGSFSYYSDGSVAGTVASIEFRSSGAATYRIDGLAADAWTVQNYLYTAGGTQGLYAYLLQGDDVLSAAGAPGSVLDGHGGADRFAVDGARYTLIGGSGIDTADYGSAAAAVTVNLASGQASDASGSASLSGIEHLIGTRHADRLSGSADANRLDGGGGADTLAGGAGDDSYVVDVAGDVVIELAGLGIDTIESAIGLTLADGVEQLVLTGSAGVHGDGNALGNGITGNAGANRLSGRAGNDTLSGGAGADTLVGGAGDDFYDAEPGIDTIVEAADGGFDTLRLASSSLPEGGAFALSAGLEGLLSLGDLGRALTGNALANRIESGGGNDRLDGGAGRDTLVGGAGDDTYVVGHSGDLCIEDAFAAGTDTVEASISYILPGGIEQLRLIGDGNIDGTGNAAHNLIVGNGGANRLAGGGAFDTLVGGDGNDTYVLARGFELETTTVTEAAGGGIDTVMILAEVANLPNQPAYQLAEHFENLTIYGDGDGDGSGNAAANVLRGNAGRNILDGAAGADTMVGGAGHDQYVVDDAGDVVREGAGGGIDLVLASVSHVLADHVEWLYLSSDAGLEATGNALANILSGAGGADRLDGGLGADSMYGGSGNDSYVVDRADDVIGEAENYNGGGVDTVISAVSWVLGDYSNLEHLSLSGSADLDATGNQLANRLTGNAGSNQLDGREGADTMRGGAGDDDYLVRETGDRVIETAGGGIDHVRSEVGFTLGAHVEHLTLLYGSAGIGNALANRIVDAGPDYGAGARLEGLGGNDTLVGSAWGEADFGNPDTLVGGLGDDRYEVHRTAARVVEQADQGHDLVAAWSSYVLSAHVEDLLLAGSAAIDGSGNAGANAITGNGAANELDGRGGADTLTGGDGADRFVLSSTLASDTITDFARGIDSIGLRQPALAVGNGDLVVDSGVETTGGFSSGAELVILTPAVAGPLSSAAAATALGSATGAYAAGDRAIFVVGNGVDSAVFLFESAGADATVSAGELTQLALLTGSTLPALSDFAWIG